MRIDVLDKGYVQLRDHMGSDDSVVSAARVSFDKRADQYTPNQNKRLLRYLATHGHWSPFSHVSVSFEIKAPVMVVNQLYKHRIGGRFQTEAVDDPWNEMSGRYVSEDLEFYIPHEWRSAPDNRKQGSGEALPEEISRTLRTSLGAAVDVFISDYIDALDFGAAPEQARLFLPYAALYTKLMWTPTLATVLRFLHLREDEHAQYEIREYANAIHTITQELFPESFRAFDMYREE